MHESKGDTHPRPRVLMYSRRRCGLCDRAREAIAAVAGEAGEGFEEVFVEADEALERAYGLRVPVVLVDGVEEFEAVVEASRLRELLLPRA